MKWMCAVCLALMLGACAHPLEQVVDQRRMELLEQSYANQPLSHGAGDRLGNSMAADGGITLGR